jgi:Spy/CpxP family protein refolding chaperone
MQKKYGGVFVLLMLLGGLAAADGSGWGSRRDRDEMRGKIKTELGLTNEQEKKLETHRIDQRAEMEKLMLVVKEKREELKAALENPKMNHHAVERINDDLKTAQNDMADKRLEGILYVREVLTPEQFKKFLSLRPGREGKEGRRGERGKKEGSRDRSGYGSKHDGYEGGHDSMDDDPMDRPKSQ